MNGFRKSELNTCMKLIEAKYDTQTDNRKVVIVDNLPFADIIEQRPPFIDHLSGALVLSADLRDDKVHEYGTRNYESERYQTRKLLFPWQAELAGTDRQIEDFLRIHFPTWSPDIHGPIENSNVWKMEDVERAARAAKVIKPVKEQVDKILNMRKPINEAKYYRAKTASDVYDQMDKVLDYTLFVGDGDVDVADFGLGDIRHGDPNSPEVATVYLIVSNQNTEEDSIQTAKEFLRNKDILYHDIKSEVTGVENQWYVEAQYVDPINEATYEQPGLKFRTLKRIYRYVQELIDGELDEVESKEWHYIIASKKDSDDVRNILTKELGKPEIFKVPEFKMPWLRWEKEGFWILFKDYTGLPEVEIMSAEWDNDPYVRRMNEAGYAYKKPVAAEVVNQYIDFIQEHQPRVKFGDIIVKEYDFTNTGDREFAAMYLWVLNSSFDEARIKIESFAKQFNLPYTDIDTDLHDGDQNAYHRPETHKRVFGTLWYGSEAASELAEAAYDGTRNQMFFAVDETSSDINQIVGPFSSSDDARKYTAYMEKKYGEWVTFNWDVRGHVFPDNYEVDIKSHYDWMADNV